MRLEKVAALALEKANFNRYLLSSAVSKRANELADGAEPKVEMDPKKYKYADIAIVEIAQGLIKIEGIENS
ncbi:DNA-directed RNA polymerase subunit omega [Hydrogenimonas thermophila]|uniref:DNA-directed RNA polymerase subunit omega n=1 Tax=Hydrogenimonas thermophila TaxID=223786 RepID=UPI0029370AC0|nr:DNA-directed RNA polymerase subunit omega [Hydrogenimonas thermophila]WOE69298.1 DNA-directed RNA polymerase subunit omega [Hydrogenimonas thermophila]WOE71808.1 DNA-directed RNA polymerase subunit omega [Hydrogenimonas thermophila]